MDDLITGDDGVGGCCFQDLIEFKACSLGELVAGMAQAQPTPRLPLEFTGQTSQAL